MHRAFVAKEPVT